MAVSGKFHAPTALPPRKKARTHRVGDCVGTRAGVGVLNKWKNVSPLPGFGPRTLQPVAESLYRLHHPGSWSHLTTYNFFKITILWSGLPYVLKSVPPFLETRQTFWQSRHKPISDEVQRFNDFNKTNMTYISPTSDSKVNQFQCIDQCNTTQLHYLSPSRWGWTQTTSLHVTRCVVVQQTHTLQADRSTPCPAAKGSLCGPLWDTSAGAPVLVQEEMYLQSNHHRHEQPLVA